MKPVNRNCSLLILAGSLVFGAVASAAVLGPCDSEATENFDTLKPGSLPSPWEAGVTAGPLLKEGYSGPITSTWEIVADADALSKPNVLKASGIAPFRLLVKTDEIFRDGYVEVRGKAISGEIDNSIGLVFRYQDANNYYVVRTNALESDIGMYRVVGGKRTPIAHTPEGMDIPAGEWLTLRVEFFGTRNVIYLNGRILFKVWEEPNLMNLTRLVTGRGRILFRVWEEPYISFAIPSGAVGLWVKADSVTLFDNFKYGISTSRIKRGSFID